MRGVSALLACVSLRARFLIELCRRARRWVDAHNAIGRGMFKKESDISLFENLKVCTAAGDVGILQGAFGKSGKYKVYFPAGVADELRSNPASDAQRLVLTFKRFVFDKACVRMQ